MFPQIQVGQDEIERYYAEHQQEFEEPEAVRVLQIVVTSKDEAAQMREKLRKSPQTFAEMAQQVLHRAGGEATGATWGSSGAAPASPRCSTSASPCP